MNNHKITVNRIQGTKPVSSPDPFRAVLLACYEMGHQPLSLAWPLAVLKEAGIPVTGLDLSVLALDMQLVSQAAFVGIAVPMLTAMRLGIQAAREIRRVNPDAHICFYGLYAWLNADFLLDDVADSIIAGEYEQPLLELVQALQTGRDLATVAGVSTAHCRNEPHKQRVRLPLPDRTDLPPLTNYAHLVYDGQRFPAGYVESTRGCLHTCRHCPVVPVYGGRFFVIPADTVLADIRQQVAAGARHITFGDPDFLNGPGHALKIARALHQEFPQVTFDFTTKVEHILKHRALIGELRELGAAYVVSAFESVSDRVLAHLDKGHTVADMDECLAVLEEAGLPVQPTWVAFTPWTTLDDYLACLDWIRTRGLVQNVPTVQYGIRLLIPPNSALLNQPDTKHWIGDLDAENFTYLWRHPDPRMDELQRRIAAFAEQAGEDHWANFRVIEGMAYEFAGQPAPEWSAPAVHLPPPPRLTEDWFC